MRRISVVTLLAGAVVAAHLAHHLAARRPPPPAPAVAPVVAQPAPRPACPATPEIGASDWKPMLDALRARVDEEERTRRQSRALRKRDELEVDIDATVDRIDRSLVTYFEACQVRFHGTDQDLLAETALGGMWIGAHFRRERAGWKVLGLDGGDIR